jgi:hypothetical protein
MPRMSSLKSPEEDEMKSEIPRKRPTDYEGNTQVEAMSEDDTSLGPPPPPPQRPPGATPFDPPEISDETAADGR